MDEPRGPKDEPLGPNGLQGTYTDLPHELRPSSDMWRAVIVRAVRDLGIIIPDGRWADRSTYQLRTDLLDAAQWIGTIDFKEVCVYAFVDAKSLEAELRGIVTERQPYRTYRLNQLADQIEAGHPPQHEDTL